MRARVGVATSSGFAGALSMLALSGCLLGQDQYKGLANTPGLLDGAEGATLIAPLVLGDAYAKEGDEVIVELHPDRRLCVDEGTTDCPTGTDVTLGGAHMTLVASTPALADGAVRYRRVLDGTEGDGPKSVSGTLVASDGKQGAFRTPVLVTADFVPPTATCSLSPTNANADDVSGGRIKLLVTPSEQLFSDEPGAHGVPVVTSSDPRMRVASATEVGSNRFEYGLTPSPAASSVVGYELIVSGKDRAGNDTVSMCEPSSPIGTVRGAPPTVDEAHVTVAATPSVEIDGAPWVRSGAVVTVTLPTAEPVDTARSTVALSGIPLAFDTVSGAWTRTFDGTEGDGLKDLDAVMVDASENRATFHRASVVRLDFTSPVADCVLSPPVANGEAPVVLDLYASEPLDGTVLAVSDDAQMSVTAMAVDGTTYPFAIAQTVPHDGDYTLTITAHDRVGNPQTGSSLCTLAQRKGMIAAIAPELTSPDAVTLTATPSVDVAGVPWVRAGAVVTVTLPTRNPIDATMSRVTLSGLEMTYVSTNQWQVTLQGTEGDGSRDLDARLVDSAGNTTPVVRADVIRFDFTPPVAGCVLFPLLAPQDGLVSFEVFASEALQGGRADVTPLDPDVSVAYVPELSSGDHEVFEVQTQSVVDVPSYELVVTATDLVGNTQEGYSLCLAEDRTGAFLSRPSLVGVATLTVEPSVPDAGGLRRARAGATLTLTLPTTSARLAYAESTVTLSGVVLTHVTGDTWTGVLAGDEGDGLKTLQGRLVDEAGNVTPLDPDVAFVADFTAPSVVSAVLTRTPYFAPADDGSGVVRFTDRDPRTSQPVTGTLTVTADEALLSARAVDVVGPGTLAWSAAAVSGRRAVYDLPGVGASAEGTYVLRAVLTDAVGNVSDPATLDARVVVDRTGPAAPPNVDTPDLVVYTRIPWGSVGTGGTPWFGVSGGLGAVEPYATVALENLAGTIVSTVQADSTGAFTGLRSPADLPDLEIAQLDAAGNPSVAARVRDVSWTATMGGKVRGSAFPNPNVLREAPQADGGRPALPEVADPAAAARPGTPVSTSGQIRWTEVTPTTTRPAVDSTPVMAWDPVRRQVILFAAVGRAMTGQTLVWDGRKWSDVTPASGGPTGREGHAMTWDPVREQVILFGGNDTQLARSDLWAWDGASWIKITPSSASPPPRRRAAMAWDPVRREVVLFGGQSGEQYYSDTWVWDGVSWTRLSPPSPGPSPRYGAAMAWDPVGQQIVLFGGTALGDFVASDTGSGGHYTHPDVSDTWAWDGATWTEVTPADGSPPGGFGLVMSWDPVGRQDVLYAQQAQTGLPWNQVWTWNGSHWTDRSPGGGPLEIGREPAMTWDPVRQQTILFNSRNPAFDQPGASYPPSDTWAWDGDRWNALGATTAGPSTSAINIPMTTDPVAGQIVLFGGEYYNPYLFTPTWIWDGAKWDAPYVHTGSPAPRGMQGASWDGVRGGVLLFGGRDVGSGSWKDDTWFWDGEGWWDVSPPTGGPSPRTSPKMAWDPVHQQVVLFGGEDLGSGLSDTWVWDGTSWTDVSPAAGGPAAVGDWMGWDDIRQEIVLIDAGKLWAWDGRSWTDISPAVGGPAWFSPLGLAYDPIRRKVLLFGTREGDAFGSIWDLDDSWLFDGVRWTNVTPTTGSPPPRDGHTMAWDPVSNRVLLFGGENGDHGAFSDTWACDFGAASRPGQVLDVDWDSALAPDAALRSVTARWSAGGVGYPDGVTTEGAVLSVWDGWHWLAVDSNLAGPDAVADLCWSVRADESAPAAGACATTTDAWLLRGLFAQLGTTQLHFSVQPVAPNGMGHPADPSKLFGEVATDTVEVEVWYRLPAQ